MKVKEYLSKVRSDAPNQGFSKEDAFNLSKMGKGYSSFNKKYSEIVTGLGVRGDTNLIVESTRLSL